MQARTIIVAAVAALLLAAGAVRAAITIDTVPVGDAGNAADTRYATPGYGAVAYTYNIGKYEVTAGQYTEFLNAVAKTDTYGLYNTDMWSDSCGCKIQQSGTSGSYAYSVDPNWANRPVNYVSWGDAARFANWLTNGSAGLGGPAVPQDGNSTEAGTYWLNGAVTNAELMSVSVPDANQRALWSSGSKRYFLLPSEDEWYKAAYHKNDGNTGNYWDYPTGSDSVPGRDMTEAKNPGNNANYEDYGYLIGSPYYRTPVGEFELSDSPYGTFDQGGNVQEWNEAIIFSSERGSSERGLRGGTCFNPDLALRGSDREYGSPTIEQDNTGFRVAEVPEPATLSLLALGGLAMLRRRWK